MHTLGLRMRDTNGLWSLYERKHFIVQKFDISDIVAAEFFLDSDPGPGAGIPVALTPGAMVDEDVVLMIPNNVPAGYHEMGIRVRDSNGKWSLYEYRDVKICPVIAPNELIQNSSCPLIADGSVSLDPTNGNDPYTYVWSNGATTKDISGLLPGTYTVSITDEDTCTSVHSFQILSGDQTLPVIQLLGDASIQHCQGVPYSDAGATAQDNCDGDISGQILVDNQVDINSIGIYNVDYDVTDMSGNAAIRKTRTVEVIACVNLTCPADFKVCITEAPFLLTGATPSGGTYSGPGVMSGIFDPGSAGLGTHTITYTLGAQSCDFEIEVYARYVYNVDDGIYYCSLSEALSDPQTSDGETIEILAGYVLEACISVTKSIHLKPLAPPLTIDCLEMQGIGKTLTLEGDLIINELNLTNGIIRTNSHNLRCGNISGGSGSSYVVTD